MEIITSLFMDRHAHRMDFDRTFAHIYADNHHKNVYRNGNVNDFSNQSNGWSIFGFAWRIRYLNFSVENTIKYQLERKEHSKWFNWLAFLSFYFGHLICLERHFFLSSNWFYSIEIEFWSNIHIFRSVFHSLQWIFEWNKLNEIILGFAFDHFLICYLVYFCN